MISNSFVWLLFVSRHYQWFLYDMWLFVDDGLYSCWNRICDCHNEHSSEGNRSRIRRQWQAGLQYDFQASMNTQWNLHRLNFGFFKKHNIIFRIRNVVRKLYLVPMLSKVWFLSGIAPSFVRMISLHNMKSLLPNVVDKCLCVSSSRINRHPWRNCYFYDRRIAVCFVCAPATFLFRSLPSHDVLLKYILSPQQCMIGLKGRLLRIFTATIVLWKRSNVLNMFSIALPAQNASGLPLNRSLKCRICSTSFNVVCFVNALRIYMLSHSTFCLLVYRQIWPLINLEVISEKGNLIF